MALPDPENLAYRGINTGNAGYIAYRGFMCNIVISLWNDAIRFSTYIKRKLNFRVEL